jgi:hypothetical protein
MSANCPFRIKYGNNALIMRCTTFLLVVLFFLSSQVLHSLHAVNHDHGVTISRTSFEGSLSVICNSNSFDKDQKNRLHDNPEDNCCILGSLNQDSLSAISFLFEYYVLGLLDNISSEPEYQFEYSSLSAQTAGFASSWSSQSPPSFS